MSLLFVDLHALNCRSLSSDVFSRGGLCIYVEKRMNP